MPSLLEGGTNGVAGEQVVFNRNRSCLLTRSVLFLGFLFEMCVLSSSLRKQVIVIYMVLRTVTLGAI